MPIFKFQLKLLIWWLFVRFQISNQTCSKWMLIPVALNSNRFVIMSSLTASRINSRTNPTMQLVIAQRFIFEFWTDCVRHSTFVVKDSNTAFICFPFEPTRTNRGGGGRWRCHRGFHFPRFNRMNITNVTLTAMQFHARYVGRMSREHRMLFWSYCIWPCSNLITWANKHFRWIVILAARLATNTFV